jgi:GNAT superfamily N-acetyltransferase
MHEVRKATGADVPELSAALARAFHDDPVFTWMFPTERARRRWGQRFFAIRLRQLLPQGEVYAVGRRGSAVWAQPERWDLGWRGFVDLLPLMAGLGRRILRASVGNARMEALHRRLPPHWYLAVLGVDPPDQGAGMGSALLGPVLHRCDGDGIGAYLETATEKDIAFYSRFGFRVTGEIQFPKGPTLWPMWRDPR